jgi:hypothetical protein
MKGLNEMVPVADVEICFRRCIFGEYDFMLLDFNMVVIQSAGAKRLRSRLTVEQTEVERGQKRRPNTSSLKLHTNHDVVWQAPS